MHKFRCSSHFGFFSHRICDLCENVSKFYFIKSNKIISKLSIRIFEEFFFYLQAYFFQTLADILLDAFTVLHLYLCLLLGRATAIIVVLLHANTWSTFCRGSVITLPYNLFFVFVLCRKGNGWMNTNQNIFFYTRQTYWFSNVWSKETRVSTLVHFRVSHRQSLCRKLFGQRVARNKNMGWKNDAKKELN